MDELNELLGSLPGFDSISEVMKTSALAGALIPDTDGTLPGHPGYTETHDVFFAALTLVGFLQSRPAVTNTNSEGTGVTVTPTDWRALRSYYASQSVICGLKQGVLTRVPIPDEPYVQRVDMTGRGTSYGDVDTDLS